MIHENLETNVLKRPLIIFPEGGTTQSNTLIKFQDGAFSDLQSIQPIALKYIYNNFDPSWTNDVSPLWLLFRMCCQFTNHLSVEYYDIINPDYNSVPTNENKELSNQEISSEQLTNQTLVEQFKNKVLNCYLTDPFFILTNFTMSDSRLTSKLRTIHKIPIQYITQHILENGNNGVKKICGDNSITRQELEKIIVNFYKCNKTFDGKLNFEEFSLFILSINNKNMDELNNLFDIFKSYDNKIDFKSTINCIKLKNKCVDKNLDVVTNFTEML
jgi:hypothetical protein